MRPKNWNKFQHYKNRRPPWIKLHHELLDDKKFHSLRGDDAKHLVMIWLIASEENGDLPELAELAFRLRIPDKQCEQLVSRLSAWLEHSASNVLAECKQDATPEESRGEKEVEEEKRESKGASAPPPKPAPSPAYDFNANPEENIPEGLAITQYAHFVCERARIPSNYTLKVHFGDAIEMLAEMEACTTAVATKRMLDRVRAASPGTKWNFWLQDGGWKKEAVDGANKPSAAKQRVDGNRRAIAEALAKRGVSGPWDAFRKDGATVPESGSVEHVGGVHGGSGSVSPEVLPPISRGRGGNVAR